MLHSGGYGLALKKGLIASVTSSVSPWTLNFYYQVFNGKPSFIGQPRSDGGGVYVYTNCIYVSSTTDKEEGIQEFITYLLSETTQLRNSENGNVLMPVRMDIMDEFLEYCREPGKTATFLGIDYVEKCLSDEQIELYKEFFERAEPTPDGDNELYDIICEELVPYLDGNRTLEEAADIMDNRVQLYLNERKLLLFRSAEGTAPVTAGAGTTASFSFLLISVDAQYGDYHTETN